MAGVRERLLIAALLASALALFFVDLGGSAIWDANEAFYVETPREMIERGDFVLPTFNYEPRVNKPVLSYWIVAGFYKLFGVSVAVQRIPIAIGGVAIVLITFFLGRLTVSRIEATGGGLWAAMGMAVSPRLMMFSRRIFIDIYITVFMAATLLFFALAESHPRRRRLFLSLMYVSVGLGVLTKGPVAAVLPGLVFLVYLLVHRELHRAKEMMIPWGIVLVLAIVVPWYAALYQRDGWTPIVSFFLGENIGRFSEGVGYDTGRGPLFYVGVLFSDGFPWSFLLFAALAVTWQQRAASSQRPRPLAARPESRILTLSWIWIATIVIFFSFSASKQDLYIYPVMPAVAALGAAVIIGGPPSGRWLSALMGLMLAAAGAGILYVFQATGNVYELAGVALFGGIVVAGGVAALALSAAGRWRLGLLLFLAAGVLGNWVLVWRVLPSFEKYKPVPPITAFLQTHATDDDVIAHYSIALPSMVFYMRRHIDITYDRDTFIRIMRQPKRVFGVLWTEEYERIRSDLGIQTCAMYSTPSFNVKLGAVMKREKLPEVVVITNRCEVRNR